MTYTKSELREAKKSIEKDFNSIKDNAPYIHTDGGINLLNNVLVVSALRNLLKTLPLVKNYIIDNDDYNLAIKINNIISPAWNVYCSRANVGEFETHSEAHLLQKTITDLQDWIKEQKPLLTKSKAEVFLKAFESIAHDCIASIGFKYRTRKEKPKKPTDIVGQMEAYKKAAVISAELFEEIHYSIMHFKTPSETEQYITTLLLPFKELCEVLRPPTPTNESRLFINLLCTGKINQEKSKPGTIEHCLRSLMNDMNLYALGLYNVLIQNSIDLNEYQEKTGVYLRKEWNPANGMFFSIGDWDLIENLPLVDRDEQHVKNKTTDSPIEEKEKPSTPPRQVQGKSKPTRYSTNIKESNARKVFSLLAAQGYISNNTQPSEWLWICGFNTEKEPTTKQIDWLKGQNELVYFVDRMFKEVNENELWVITSRVFTIKGKEQKSNNLKTANSKICIKNEKKVKLDNILKYK